MASRKEPFNGTSRTHTHILSANSSSQNRFLISEFPTVKKYLTNKCDRLVQNEGGTLRGVFGSSYGTDDWTALLSIGMLLPINTLISLMLNEGLWTGHLDAIATSDY
ncbi:hypothetical protein AC579_7160 [Pseudocercospora musae]|uniref:Uncharacterized protein n=1 Tax=Pseudocercospora musae TaxID=113226 RepID=A0A139HBA7_9PEZI|nr:hypothetical protein AC579_7160 [Pseudocercospora musae]